VDSEEHFAYPREPTDRDGRSGHCADQLATGPQDGECYTFFQIA